MFSLLQLEGNRLMLYLFIVTHTIYEFLHLSYPAKLFGHSFL